jgi:hypothetical protein
LVQSDSQIVHCASAYRNQMNFHCGYDLLLQIRTITAMPCLRFFGIIGMRVLK